MQLSIQQKDALCVLLTGRSESGFGELVRRIVTSKGLEFDMVSLKPAVGPSNQRFASTMIFKQAFLEALMETYKYAREIRIYEDRPKHVKGFRDFMGDYNTRQDFVGGPPTRGPIQAEVVQVADSSANLDPVVEVAEVQHLVNAHNEALVRRSTRGGGLRGEKLIIKRTVFYTGYLIKPADTQRLLALVAPSGNLGDVDLKFHANNIMICPRPCPQSILEKVGGMGSKMTWLVTGTARLGDTIWAACLEPVPATAKYHTDNPIPLVVLALRKGARPVDASKIQKWQPVPPAKTFTFETTVGEKVLLRIEADDPSENEYESLFPNKVAKRRHIGNEEPSFRQQSGSYGQTRNYHQYANPGRGGPSQGRGGYRNSGTPARGYRNGGRGGVGGAARGRGGKGKHYHSLDDVGTRDSQGGQGAYRQQVVYDDTAYTPPPPPPPPQQPRAAVAQQQAQQQAHYNGGWQNRPPPTGPQRMTGGGNRSGGYGESQNYF